MLEQLSKRDNEWRKIALKICGNKQLADEIVQDMYIKLSKGKNKILNTSYVSYCMYHIYLDMIKKEKASVDVSELSNVLHEPTIGDGLDDNQLKCLDIFNSLPWGDKQIMIKYQTLSIRQIQDEFNINRGTVYNTINKVKSTVKNG